MQTSKEDRSLGELFGDLSRDMGSLVRQEFQLATTEMSQKAKSAGRDVGMMVGGGLVAYGGFLVLLAALTLVLALFLPGWVSALIVGLLVVAIGGIVAIQGLNALKKIDFVPRKTVETVKEDVQWAKEQAS